jgi:hypothetical protein
VRRLTAGQLADFRKSITAVQAIGDDRGFQHWAGIHGLPLPIFGHGGCFGDVGHCDIPASRDPFDLRPPHQLEPALRVLTVTDAVNVLLERGIETAKVTVNARTAPRKAADVPAFDTVRLATYA